MTAQTRPVDPGVRSASSRWFRGSSASLVPDGPDRLELNSSLTSRHCVVFTESLFDHGHDTLAQAIGERDSLIVTTPTVDRLYGEQIRSYLDAYETGRERRYVVLDCTEATKTLDTVARIVDQAAAMRLGRRSPIVAIGGGVCLDICGFAASIYRRGVPHIKIPTTLLGLIDAGIGTKNGLNFGRGKSTIGAFHPPEFSLISREFLATLGSRYLRCGLAESLKMAIVCDPDLFAMIENYGPALATSHYREPAAIGRSIVRRSVTDMLEQLSENLFENETLERLVDFGHTFSPAIESASRYEIHHGEAVAIDMAISVLLARNLSWLSAADADRVLRVIAALGLPVFPTCVSASALWDSLASVTAHRGGRLHLPLPTRLGSCVFLPDREAIGGVAHLEQLLQELQATEAAALV